MAQLFERKSLYCYLFTDASDPAKYVKEIKQALPSDLPIFLDYRSQGNSHDQHVLEDFFSFFQFDALIYPQSNFSMIPALIHDYTATYTIESIIQTESGEIEQKTSFSIDEERRQDCLRRIENF